MFPRTSVKMDARNAWVDIVVVSLPFVVIGDTGTLILSSELVQAQSSVSTYSAFSFRRPKILLNGVIVPKAADKVATILSTLRTSKEIAKRAALMVPKSVSHN